MLLHDKWMCYISKVVTFIISHDKYCFKKFSLCPQNILVCCEGCKSPNVSIRPSSSAYPCQGHGGGLSQLRGREHPGQSIAGLTHKDRQLSTFTFTTLDNLESLINLTALTACLWTVGARWCTWREPMHVLKYNVQNIWVVEKLIQYSAVIFMHCYIVSVQGY